VKGLYFDSNACSCEIERSSFFGKVVLQSESWN